MRTRWLFSWWFIGGLWLVLAVGAIVILSGCEGDWTRVPGECEGMHRTPDSGNSPCPPGHPEKVQKP